MVSAYFMLQVFPATATVGMVTVNTFNVVYQFQMTASVYVGTVENEGELSGITKRSTVFVPKPGEAPEGMVRYQRGW